VKNTANAVLNPTGNAVSRPAVPRMAPPLTAGAAAMAAQAATNVATAEAVAAPSAPNVPNFKKSPVT
jgi:hypothetical protein